jgi:hypothetical protein
MRVRCERILSVAGPKEELPPDADASVAHGEEYTVLSILVDPRSEARDAIALQILDSDGPAWWPGEMFTTVSTRIPSNWIAVVDELGFLHIAPAAWLTDGFWEQWYEEYYGTRGAALDTYERELETILREA